MIELLATLAGLAFCFGVGLLFEVNHQAATQRGLFGVEGAIAAWDDWLPEGYYAELVQTTYGRAQQFDTEDEMVQAITGHPGATWNPTLTYGSTVPGIAEARERAAAKEVLGI